MLRQVGIALAFAPALAGCIRHGGETWIFPLDELNAELRIGRDSRATAAYASSMVQLFIVGNSGDYCRIVSPRETRATMNGSPGEVFPGEEYRGSFNDDDDCIAPQFGWDSSPTGVVEFVIKDDSASWSFVVENPFEALYPRTELLSHDTENPIKSGDTVRLEVQTVHSVSNTRVYMRNGADMVFDISEANGLTRTGTELSFVMPAVAMAMPGSLTVTGDIGVEFSRCDAPLGCKTEYAFNDNVSVAIAP